jgi:hypothetical protein
VSKIEFDTMAFTNYPDAMSKAVSASKHRPSPKARARTPAVRKSSSAKTAAAAVVKTKTLRLAPEYEAGLALLKGVLGTPVNKMVNEAVGEYIRKRSAEVEADLKGVLEQVKAYRRADPQFKQARARFVDAEVQLGADDPVEGVVVDVQPPTVKRRSAKAGPAQMMIRELLKSPS